MSDLRTRIAEALYQAVLDTCGGYVEGQEGNVNPDPGHPDESILVDGPLTFTDLADAVIRELGLHQEWRADLGYDGYSRCENHAEAKELVDDYNEALGDDVQDGEQAMVLHRYTTTWTADA